MALGLTLGIVLAVSNGGATHIAQSALGTCASASASPAASAPAVAASASAAPCTSASPAAPAAASATAAAAAVAPAPSNANGPTAFRQLGNLASAPVDGAGNALNLNQNADQAAASGTCTITAPANPLSAQGLATPWVLGDGCAMANSAEQAFVEATILAPNGSVQVYNPLVITQGTTPAAAPAAPTIAAGSQVIIDGGFNGVNLVVLGNGARRAGCVDALGQSLIGQVFACNAVNFYRMANALIARGTLVVPPAGTAKDGQACLTTRDFGTVDQDQSDNVITSYLLNGNGQTAQNTAANAAAVAGSAPVRNGSDDLLLAAFLDAANGCTAFTAPDPTDPAGTSGSQALNELSARVNQKGTIAVVPTNDEMTLVGGAMSIAKTNVYRSLVDQPLLAGNASAAQVAADYCQNMVNIQPARNQLDMTAEAAFGTPVAAVGNNLATFLGNRLTMSFTNLGCNNFGLTSPVTVTLDGNQVATAVTYALTQQKAAAQAAAGGGNGTANPPARGHRRGHRFQNPSGM
ncbi:MAG TPA: hypothetical protein VFW50_30310 [Streptosporangiaceae bacterium]|nr:hypothetical protein [Streptosporangiaceae bacterium]